MQGVRSLVLRVVAFSVIAATPAAGQQQGAAPTAAQQQGAAPASVQDRTACFNGPPPERIASCTRLIASRTLSGNDLAQAYQQRALGVALVEGNYDAVIADTSEALRLNPKHGSAYGLRGAAHVRKGNLDRALADLNEARRLEPKNPTVLNGFGLYYEAKGERERALSEFDEAIRLLPQFASAYRNRAVVYEATGQLLAALADFKTALGYDPDKKQLHGRDAADGIARVQQKIAAIGPDWGGCFNSAPTDARIDVCARLIASGKLAGRDLAQAHFARANAISLVRGGNFDAVLADASETVRLDPKHASAWGLRGAVQVRKGNLERAFADLNEALRLEPANASVHGAFGIYHHARGDYERAIVEYNEAVRLQPQFTAAYRNRGLAYESSGQLAAALADFKTAVGQDPDKKLKPAQEAAQGIARVEQKIAARREQVAAVPSAPAAAKDSIAVVPGRRFALVIGNDKYDNLLVLQKAVNDARAVAGRLQRLGFDVILVENANRRTMNEKLSALSGKVGRGDTAFFFFAGHGVSIKDGNYLLPTDTPAAGEGQEGLISREAMGADSIVEALQERGAAVSVLVLDACRDNPFKNTKGRGVGGGRGLNEMRAPEGVFVLYSAGFGQSALDRLSDRDANPNSVFTRTFVQLLDKPGLSLQELAKATQSEVKKLSSSVSHQQMPAYYDQIDGALALTQR